MKTNFDDILKRKLAQRQFPVDESHRQEMIDLLNNENRRRPFPFWWIGGLMVLAILAGLYFNTNDDLKSLPVEQETAPLEIASPAESMEMAHADEVDHESAIDRREKANSVIQEINSPISSRNSDSEQIAIPQNQQTVNTPDIMTNEKTDVEESFTTNTKRRSSTDGQFDVSKPVSMNGGFQSEERLIDNATPLDQTDGHSSPLLNKSAIEVSERPIQSRSSESLAHLESIDMSGISYFSAVGFNEIQPAAAYKKSLFVFGETGLGFVLGSKPDFDAGWKLRIGAGLGFSFSPKVQVTLSAGYLYQNGGFDFQRLSSVNQPGFGTRSSFNTLTPNKLHFVYGKAGIQTRSRRHILAAHAGMQLLYGAQGDITTIVEDQFAGTTEMNEYAWLKTSGLRKLNWAADFSYGYQITPHLSISVGADYYFSSFTVEDPFLESEGFTWSGAYSPFQPFINLNYLLYGRL